MRTSLAAVALIRREAGGQTKYLAQWNESWRRYSLVGGHKHDDETFRECLLREVREELGLIEGAHYRVADGPIARLEFEAWSERAGEQTAYTFEVFELTLLGTVPEALRLIDSRSANRWLTRQEIDAGQTCDGIPLSDILNRYFLYNRN